MIVVGDEVGLLSFGRLGKSSAKEYWSIHEQVLSEFGRRYGARVVGYWFDGWYQTLEHYPGMTEKALAGIVDEAKSRWRIYDATVIHRIGELKPTDQIVLVIATSAHRGDAFAACEFIMDYLKTRAPFWKKEQTPAGERWVEARTSDDEKAARW